MLNDIIEYVQKESTIQLIILSLLLILFVHLIKYFLWKSLLKNKDQGDITKVTNHKKLNNTINILLVVLLFSLWFVQLQSIFVSIIAIAAAIVLALKELIMCLTGGFLVKINNYFKEGDRISINKIRGFVIEKNLTTTKILELGPDEFSQQTTGNIQIIPNSMMLTNPIKNESYFKNFTIKSFFYHIEQLDRMDDFESQLLDWANEICAPYLTEAKKTIYKTYKKEDLQLPTIEPRTKIIINEENEIQILVKLPVKNESIGDVEQVLNRKYIQYISQFPQEPTSKKK